MAYLRYVFVFCGLLVAAKPSTTDSNSRGTCNFVKTDSSGEILSPSYPQPYPEDIECTWEIKMPLFETIVVVFKHFNLNSPSGDFFCERGDFVEVYDEQGGLLGKYCAGNLPPRQITSKSNILRVVFKSHNRTTESTALTYQSGFSAIYASCGGFFTDAVGLLQSPSYPDQFPADIHCLWQIRVPSDYVIELRFKDFQMDGMYPCSVDYVRVKDGFNTNSTELGHFCTTRLPNEETPVRSTDNKMSLEFKSYKESNSRGFKAEYTRVSHCNGLLQGDYGRFTSPGYPGSRQIDRTCSWLITVSEEKIVSLRFDFFAVDSFTGMFSISGDCGDDFVELFDGTSSDDPSLGKFCTVNNKPTDMVRSSGRQMFVKLKTSFRNEGDGFSASYYGMDPYSHFAGCSLFDQQLLFTCNNGQRIQCQWKCDGTNDCTDASDELFCKPTPTPTSQSSSDIRNYVIVILSITGSCLSIVCIGFMIDRLRRKRIVRPRRRHNLRRLRRSRLSSSGDAPLTDEPSSPPPPYENACYGVSFIQPHLTNSSPQRGSPGAFQNSRRIQAPEQVLSNSSQENTSANVRTEQMINNSEQINAQEIQAMMLTEEEERRDGIHGNVVIGTVSPSESINSLNDTAPLIHPSESVIEL